jgi:uncharacterized protein involved in response to NO
MATTAETLRAYRGPAFFSYGFRPFFLGGAIWAAAAMALFYAMFRGQLALPTAFNAIDWHIHELLFGYLPAVVAGFLLTAVPNWTGRLPVAGAPLAALFVLWLAGRAAVAASSVIGAAAAAAIDVAFLLALGFIVAREIVAAKNLRNLKVLVLVALLGIGNLVFHIEAINGSRGGYGQRLGVAAAVLLIVLIGGRIVPSFTRNWLVKAAPGHLPVPFGRFDIAVIGVSALALLAWLAVPESAVTAMACGIAAALQFIRVARWKGYRTFKEPLVMVLHAGYVFVPIGFLLLALAIATAGTVSPVAGIHAWTAGAIGLMTLAVMTRASLGHTGRPLEASAAITGIYASAGIAAVARILAALGVEPPIMLAAAALGWVAAFLSFSILFGPMLAKARPQK